MLLIGNRLAIKGDWDKEVTPVGRETILLQPSSDRQGNPYMPYTRSMLEIMEVLIPPAVDVLDFGAGNGVLSLAAVRLGATSVKAYENRSDVCEIVQGNVQINRLASKIEVLNVDFTQAVIPPCDLILCDIDVLDILETAIRQARRSIRAGGHFVCVLLQSDLWELDATTGAEFLLVGQEPVSDRWIRASFMRL